MYCVIIGLVDNWLNMQCRLTMINLCVDIFFNYTEIFIRPKIKKKILILHCTPMFFLKNDASLWWSPSHNFHMLNTNWKSFKLLQINAANFINVIIYFFVLCSLFIKYVIHFNFQWPQNRHAIKLWKF